MLRHNGTQEYAVALDAASKKFQEQLEATIEHGRASAGKLIERIQSEVPTDTIVSTASAKVTNTLHFAGHSSRPMAPLHRHALNQLCDRFGIPAIFRDRLLERDAFGKELLAENLNRLMGHDEVRRLLVREVNGEIRALLSDAFRRLDSRPIVDAAIEVLADIGALPFEGFGGDLRWGLKAILPHIFRPSEHSPEVVAYGLQISNSDFGCGAYSMRAFCLRLACVNGMTMEEALRQVHLGKRLGDDVEYSARTYRLDTETMVSATRDMVQHVLGAANVNALNARIGASMEEKMDPKAFVESLPKRGVTKAEAEQVQDTLMGGEIRQIPQGNTAYRMSNAVSWVAKSAPTAERRMELEQLAGEILMKRAS